MMELHTAGHIADHIADTKHTHLCLHWCYAHVRVVLESRHICCGSSAQQSQGQMKQWLMIWDAQHIHHQLTLLSWLCCLSQQPPYAASVSTQLCFHWFSAHLSVVLHKIFLHSPMKQQLMSLDLQHIASSTKDVVQFWHQSVCVLASMDSIAPGLMQHTSVVLPKVLCK